MLSKELAEKNNAVYECWEKFVADNFLDRQVLRDVVADSWERSRNNNINPLRGKNDLLTSRICVTTNQFEESVEKSKFLLDIAKPFMENLYKIVGDTGLIVRLTDSQGIVLECIQDDEIFNQYSNLSIFKGCNISENVIGTNAIGTSLVTGRPIQVFGAEHYCKQYHNWNSAACPIKNEMGIIVGVLSITGIFGKVHPHTLGMVVAGVEAIETQLKLNFSNKQLKLANKHLHAIMESISEGLICTDKKGIVTDINLFARKRLALEENDLVGKSINTIIDHKHKVEMLRFIRSGERCYEQEINFLAKNNKKIPCIVMTSPIIDITSQIIEGIVIVFREVKAVHSLVNKILGAEARFSFEDIIGTSPQIRNVIDIAGKAAKNDTTVLLKGESGTGKELFAQSIHNASNRKNKPFVCLNVGAIPRDLVASELFGYVEGAFTGAKRGGHPGKFELADGGTIFLDEIGDMPLDAQVSLLRVLETREIMRLGGNDVNKVNVRVIAATHKNLEEAVALGNFRQDLYYRLNVVPIEIPPLRERKEDVRMLADYFLNRIALVMGKEISGIDKSFYSTLLRYSWQGNVRELQNVIHQVLNILDDGGVLSSTHLPMYIKNISIDKGITIDNEIPTLNEVEKITIIRAIEHCDGNLSLVAKLLDIGRSSLYRKIKQYNIES